MTFMQLGRFTHEELSHFTHAELGLDIDDLISTIRNQNKTIPIHTYNTLLDLAKKYNVPAPKHSNSEWTIEQRLMLLSLIVQILMGVYSSCASRKNDTVYNNYYNINIQIQSSIDTSDNSELTDICDQIQNQLCNYKR